jgi:hypothetical protein
VVAVDAADAEDEVDGVDELEQLVESIPVKASDSSIIAAKTIKKNFLLVINILLYQIWTYDQIWTHD